MRALAILLLVALLLSSSGCLSARGPVLEGTCNTGNTAIFLKVQSFGGIAGPDKNRQEYFVDRSGMLFVVHGSYEGTTGTGQVRTESADLYHLEGPDVKAQMLRASFYNSTRDFNVTKAWKWTLSVEDFSLLCDKAGQSFFKSDPRYTKEGAADCSTTEIIVNSQRGEKSVAAECDAGSDGFKDLKESFFAVVERNRQLALVPA